MIYIILLLTALIGALSFLLSIQWLSIKTNRLLGAVGVLTSVALIPIQWIGESDASAENAALRSDIEFLSTQLISEDRVKVDMKRLRTEYGIRSSLMITQDLPGEKLFITLLAIPVYSEPYEFVLLWLDIPEISNYIPLFPAKDKTTSETYRIALISAPRRSQDKFDRVRVVYRHASGSTTIESISTKELKVNPRKLNRFAMTD